MRSACQDRALLCEDESIVVAVVVPHGWILGVWIKSVVSPSALTIFDLEYETFSFVLLYIEASNNCCANPVVLNAFHCGCIGGIGLKQWQIVATDRHASITTRHVNVLGNNADV
jgi:hypothetical protein